MIFFKIQQARQPFGFKMFTALMNKWMNLKASAVSTKAFFFLLRPAHFLNCFLWNGAYLHSAINAHTVTRGWRPSCPITGGGGDSTSWQPQTVSSFYSLYWALSSVFPSSIVKTKTSWLIYLGLTFLHSAFVDNTNHLEIRYLQNLN